MLLLQGWLLLTINEARNTFFTVACGVHEMPPHTNSLRAKAQSFEYVGPATNAAVYEDFHTIEDLRTPFSQFKKDHDGGGGCIQTPASVVTDQ